MLTFLALTLLAAVTAAAGERVDLNKGLIDGLRVGDRGSAYYTLRVDGVERRIEAGTVELTEVDDFASQGRSTGRSSLKPGFSVSFSGVEARQTPAELLRIASDRFEDGQLETSQRYFERLRELFPGDPLVLRRLAEIDQSRVEAPQRIRQEQNLDYYLEAAERSAKNGELELALEYCDRALQVEPSHAAAGGLQRRLLRQLRHRDMVFVQGGRVEIGLPREQARFYNEQPRFNTEIESFWIDRHPVAFQEFFSVLGRAPVAGVDSRKAAVNVSFRDAGRYCSSVGKRLPTEFEWELSAAREAILPGPVSEWTNSWYQPYPGNTQPEREYGTRYRVIRGLDSERRFDVYFRSFMPDRETTAEVGFRCAETEQP